MSVTTHTYEITPISPLDQWAKSNVGIIRLFCPENILRDQNLRNNTLTSTKKTPMLSSYKYFMKILVYKYYLSFKFKTSTRNYYCATIITVQQYNDYPSGFLKNSSIKNKLPNISFTNGISTWEINIIFGTRM